MTGSGDHRVNRNKPGLKSYPKHGFSQVWNLVGIEGSPPGMEEERGRKHKKQKVQACGQGMLRAFWKCSDKNYHFVQ